MPAPLVSPPPPETPLRRPLSARPPKPPRPPILRRLLGFVSGFGFATILLVVLGLLTWLATLEMKEAGLRPTLLKYFDWRSAFVIPKLKDELIPLPLPGGYWTCVLLALNLVLGGVLRMRKGWGQIGVLVTHGGILALLAAGAVADHWSERGNMGVWEKEASNVAMDYYEPTVEIAEIKDGRPCAVHVIRGRCFEDLTDFTVRSIKLPGLPFDMELARYHSNSVVKPAALEAPPVNTLPTRGYYLSRLKDEKNSEANRPGIIARVVQRNGAKEEPFLLHLEDYHPFTARAEGRVFTICLCKRRWVMPFTVTLNDVTAEYHPGTMKPASYRSEITRTEGGIGVDARIEMNEPMRYRGLTFYQSGYEPAKSRGGPEVSVFEVVRNPADQWPSYCLYVVTAGLLVHFLTRLIAAISSPSRPRTDRTDDTTV